MFSSRLLPGVGYDTKVTLSYNAWNIRLLKCYEVYRACKFIQPKIWDMSVVALIIKNLYEHKTEIFQ